MTDAIAAAVKPGDHGTTFGGGPFVSTVALCPSPALFTMLAAAALVKVTSALSPMATAFSVPDTVTSPVPVRVSFAV